MRLISLKKHMIYFENTTVTVPEITQRINQQMSRKVAAESVNERSDQKYTLANLKSQRTQQ